MQNRFRANNTSGYSEPALTELNIAWQQITSHGVSVDSDDIAIQSMLDHWSETLLAEYDAGKRGADLTTWFGASQHAAAAAAYSLLYRSTEASGTEAHALVELAEDRLRAAGLVDLAEEAFDIASDWAPEDGAVRALLDKLAVAAGKLEAGQ